MNKFEIHVLLAGFSTQQNSQLTTMLTPLPINIHCCTLDCAIDALPKVHVLLLGTDNIEKRSEQLQISPEQQPVTDAQAKDDPQALSSVDQEGVITLDPDEILEQFVTTVKNRPHLMRWRIYWLRQKKYCHLTSSSKHSIAILSFTRSMMFSWKKDCFVSSVICRRKFRTIG